MQMARAHWLPECPEDSLFEARRPRAAAQDCAAPSPFVPTHPNFCPSHVQPAVLLTLLDIANGLEYLHSAGMVHGDVKASAREALTHAMRATCCQCC